MGSGLLVGAAPCWLIETPPCRWDMIWSHFLWVAWYKTSGNSGCREACVPEASAPCKWRILLIRLFHQPLMGFRLRNALLGNHCSDSIGNYWISCIYPFPEIYSSRIWSENAWCISVKEWTQTTKLNAVWVPDVTVGLQPALLWSVSD